MNNNISLDDFSSIAKLFLKLGAFKTILKYVEDNERELDTRYLGAEIAYDSGQLIYNYRILDFHSDFIMSDDYLFNIRINDINVQKTVIEIHPNVVKEILPKLVDDEYQYGDFVYLDLDKMSIKCYRSYVDDSETVFKIK